MRISQNRLQYAFYLFIVFFLMFMPPVISAQTDSGKPGGAEQYVSIDFNNVDIEVFIKFISELTGTNFIIDQRVRGKITIISPSKISIDEAYQVFESVLEVYGFSTVPSGEVVKIVPSPEARSKNIETLLKESAVSPEDKIVTQLIPLKYADPDEIKKLFAPLISKNSVILSYNPTNTLIITDVHSNIQRLNNILKAIDVAGIGQEISVIPLEHADATQFVTLLESIFKTPQRPRPGQPVAVEGLITSAVQFVADDRTNTIVMLASEMDTIRIKKLIAMLDKEVPRGEERIRVYYLENATAEDLAKVLQSLSTKQPGGQGGNRAPVISENVQITADKATNSLIIMADKNDYAILEEIIQKLDIPRQMVYIEALIMEVNVDANFNIGTEWQAIGEAEVFGTETGAAGGGFTSSGAFSPLGLVESAGFKLGIVSGSVNISMQNPAGEGTIDVALPNVGAIVKAFKSDKDVHILSTPQILTTDNEEAKIVVGKNVPYQTRSSQISGTSDAYSSFEYKNVGKSLTITPQISKDRMIRLKISLEVSALDTTPEETLFRPTTLTRNVDTTIIVKDQNTVVIGGLIDDTFTDNVVKVPCLGDIPGFGWLFKTATKGNSKTNLYVFLTPYVVGSPSEADPLTEQKKGEIDQIRGGNIKIYEQNLKAEQE